MNERLQRDMLSGCTTEQLRNDIDRGRTGDKVDFPDPATAPLGTDEEAAGTPVPPHVVAQARLIECRRGHPVNRRARLGPVWILVGFSSSLAVGMVTWLVLG
jgi:hypothetical protein